MTKGYCHGHYVHHEYRGLKTAMGPPKHFLSDVDLDEETATCAICGEGTPILVSRRRGSGERYARMCMSLYPGVRERAQQRLAATSYALTAAERDEMLAQQGGTCANPSCDTPDAETSRWVRLSTDHDHASVAGAVRGLLCRRCNAAIGMAPGDNLTGVLGLAVYLAEYEHPGMAGELRRLLGSLGSAASLGPRRGERMTE